MQSAMWPVMILTRGGLREERRGTVATGLGEYRFSELAHKVGTCLGWLVRDRGLGDRGALALVPVTG